MEDLVLPQTKLFNLKGKDVVTIRGFELDTAKKSGMALQFIHKGKSMRIDSDMIDERVFHTSKKEYDCKVVPGRRYNLHYFEWKPL